MKHKVVKVKSVTHIFWGLLVVFTLQAHEQQSFDFNASDVLSNDASFGDRASSAETSLPLLFRGDLSPANTTFTITRSGVYQLTSAKTASGVPNISITADNVTLDLGGNTVSGGTNGIQITGNNVVIQNGTIASATENGVFIQGNGCFVKNCDIVSCYAGITLQNANEGVIEHCHVFGATQAGISLIESFTNVVQGCSVQELVQTSNPSRVYGFVATDGGSNIFENCEAQGLSADKFIPFADVPGLVTLELGGFVFKGTEHDSQCRECFCNAIRTPVTGTVPDYDLLSKGQAYGVGLLPGATLTGANAITSVAHNTDAAGVNSVDWLQIDGVNYLASGGGGTELFIYTFNAATNQLVTVTRTSAPDGTVSSVAWLVVGDKKYVATGGLGTNQVRIFEFDEVAHTIISVASAVADGTVLSVAWLVLQGKKYLATGSSTGTNKVRIFEFDDVLNQLTSVAAINNPVFTSVFSVAWLKKAGSLSATLAVGGTIGSNRVAFYSFDYLNNLSLLTQSPATDGTVNSVAWLPDPESEKFYLATGGTGTNEVFIFEVDVSLNVVTTITKTSAASGSVEEGAWLVAGDKKYLATGGDLPNEVHIFDFDPVVGSLVSVAVNSVATDLVKSVKWLIEGSQYYLATGCDTDDVRIFELQGFSQTEPQNCVVRNTSIMRVESAFGYLNRAQEVLTGIGLSSTNTQQYIAQNSCFDCDSSFTGVPTQFITSQANARGEYNIDTHLTTSDSVELIADQVSVIESLFDACCFTSNSKLDLLLGDALAIENNLNIVDDKIDQLGTSLGDFLLETFTIESKIDACCFTSNSKLDLLLGDALIIENKLNIVDEKIDQLGTSLGDLLLETFTIESQIDACCFTSNSKLDLLLNDAFMIESKVDLLLVDAACDATPLTTADIVGQNIVLSSAGNYCMAQDLTATVSLVGDYVSLCMNGRTLFGSLEMYGQRSMVKNGTVLQGGDGTTPVVILQTGAVNCTLSNLQITALDATSGAGRDALQIAANDAVIKECTVTGGSATSGVGGHGIHCLSPCARAQISETTIAGTGDGVGARAGNGIEIDNGCSLVDISHCRIAHTGTGSTNGIAINDQHAASTANFSSVIYNNFAYDIANTSTYYELRNLGTGGITGGVSVIVGAPGLYDNVYQP